MSSKVSSFAITERSSIDHNAGPESAVVHREELVRLELHVLHHGPRPEDNHLQGIAEQVSLARSYSMGREKAQETRGMTDGPLEGLHGVELVIVFTYRCLVN